jgi:hypothetical protein
MPFLREGKPMTNGIAKVLHRRPMLIWLLALTLLSVGYTIVHHVMSKPENTWQQSIDNAIEYYDLKDKFKTIEGMIRKLYPDVEAHIPKKPPKFPKIWVGAPEAGHWMWKMGTGRRSGHIGCGQSALSPPSFQQSFRPLVGW